MMQQACRDAAAWRDVRLNVNLSPREFEEGSIVARLKKLGDITKLNLEIIESSYIRKPEEIRPVLDEIRALGVQIWLDDFGTGHSSLSHLLHFDLDGVKIPSTFVKGVAGSKRSRAITKGIIDLAHDLGLQVIAEGVERDEQVAARSPLRIHSGFPFQQADGGGAARRCFAVALTLQGNTCRGGTRSRG